MSDRERSRGGILLGVVGAITALAVIVVTSRPQSDVPPTTTALAFPTTMANSTSTTTTSIPIAAVLTLDSFLPEVKGDLYTVIAPTLEGTFVQWEPNAIQVTRDLPTLDADRLDFDVSGLRFAFLGPPLDSGLSLYTGRPDVWIPLASRVSSFAWHATDPGLLSWVEGLERGLCTAAVDLDGTTVEEPTCFPGMDGEVNGFDDLGFLIATEDSIVRVSTSGEELGRVPGEQADIGPDGRVLIVRRNADDVPEFYLANQDLSEVVSLEWAPSDVLDGYGFVAWSPAAGPPQLAFLTDSEIQDFSIERYELDGFLVDSVDVRGRGWDIEWDSTGRYILVPGEDPGNDAVARHYTYAFDTFTREGVYLPFVNWVQDTQLVSRADCEDATFLDEHWHRYVPEGVTLDDLWMVLSRDATLESWRFLSGRLAGGPYAGEIATWILPGYSGGADPPLATPANHQAAPGLTESPQLNPDDYGVDDWMSLDGARISQWCVEALGG